MTVTLTAIEQLDEALTLIRDGLKKATSVISPELTARDFHAVSNQLSELNGLLNTRSVITSTIGFLADKHHSGDQVGSRTPETYVMNLFSVSRAEARRMIDRGKDTYSPPTLAEIRKEIHASALSANSANDGEDFSSSDEAENPPETQLMSLEDRKLEFEQAKKVHVNQKKAQNLAATLLTTNTPGEEYLHILDTELRRLEGISRRQSIRAEALKKASELTPAEFRYHLRNLVNRSNALNHDPHASFRKRYIAIGTPDADGGARITGYLPAPTLALFQQALAGANRPDATTSSHHASSTPSDTTENAVHSGVCGTAISNSTNPRKLGQRRLDTLAHILSNRVGSAGSRHSGVGSLVVSITTEELQEILDETQGARLTELIHQPRPTNTAAHISLVELMNLGLAKYDMACLHDNSTGNALYLGRTKRSANFWQKIALVAEQLVCSHPGCDVPAVNCEVHHIESWNNGGDTDIENLTLLCRNHHMDNNDNKNLHTPRGWAESDPVTGRKGYQDIASQGTATLPPVRINTGWMARQAAGFKIFTAQTESGTLTSGFNKPGLDTASFNDRMIEAKENSHKNHLHKRGYEHTDTSALSPPFEKASEDENLPPRSPCHGGSNCDCSDTSP